MHIPRYTCVVALVACGVLGRAARLRAPPPTSAASAAPDICSSSDTGFAAGSAEDAIACYAGTFLVKMLTELNSGPPLGAARKTQQHVRWHLLPYLGGEPAIASLFTDSPRDSNCTACFSDAATAAGLSALRATVPSAARAVYDGLDVCFMQLTDAVMDALPKDRGTGKVFLVPQSPAVSPFEQTRSLFRDLFALGCSYEGCAASDFTQCREPSGTAASPGAHAGVVGCSPAAKNSSASGMPSCGRSAATWVNVCDSGEAHGFSDPKEAAIFCYIASFLQKMLLELTVSPPMGEARKTEQHVRSHLTPYLGGNTTTARVKTDVPSDPNCTVCWSDPACAVHQQMWVDTPCCYDTDLPGWAEGVCPESIAAFRTSRAVFFTQQPCYAPMTNYVMEALPKVGKWLVPPRYPDTPYSLALKIVKGIFVRAGLDACGLVGNAAVA